MRGRAKEQSDTAKGTHHKLPIVCVVAATHSVLICMLSVWPVFHSNQPHCIIPKYICAKHTHTHPWSHTNTQRITHILSVFVLLLANEFHSTIERMPNYMLASQCAINLYLFVCAHLYYIIVYGYMRISLGYSV